MKGYLIYDKKDIQRNQGFIQWFLDTSADLNMALTLYDHTCDFRSLALPDYVINRSRMVHISRFYETSGVKVFNSSKVTGLANDKLKTYHYFKDHLAMMATHPSTSALFFPCVVKDRFGHGGQDVYKFDTLEDMADFEVTDTYILQEVCPQVGKDLRVYIIDNQIIASVLRTNPHDFRANYSLGGHIKLYDLTEKDRALVHKILKVLPIDYGGIDFLFASDHSLILNEIEDVVGARMLYKLKAINIVDLYLQHIKKQVLNP